ncbi:MAG: hypothetical protein ACI9TY_000533 [Alphaproteobacteria bacterium]|jgi:hypothetical protein
MFSRKNVIIGTIIIVIIVAAAIIFKNYNENKRLNAASYAVEVALKSLQNKDSKNFAKYVDTKSLSTSILAQVFEEESETAEADAGFWGAVKTLGDSLSSRLTGYIKPELANSLNTQTTTYVENGQFTEKYDLTNLYGRTPMLQKIWYDLAGDSFLFKGISDTVENELTASTNVNFYREDLDFSSSLTLLLEKKNNVWQIVAVEGLGKTLKQLDQLRTKLIEDKNSEIQSKIDASLAVLSIEKSTGVSKNEFGGKRVLLRIAFENIGEVDIKSFHASVVFKNQENNILRTVSIKDTDIIIAGNMSEKSWPMTINPLSSDDNAIFNAKPGELIIESYIQSLTLNTGVKLEFIKLEK